jgi:hypothetical protein
MSRTPPTTFDLDEIASALMEHAEGRTPRYHNLGYAWEALKRAGHSPSPLDEQRFERARKAIATTVEAPWGAAGDPG